jgi:dCMP deaminase
VGCVIVLDGRCVSWGFNGAPPGLPHCSENNHGYAGLLQEPVWDSGVHDAGCRNATHAEANALAAAARQGISTDGGSLFTTCSPCDTCSRLIIAAGIIHVYFLEEYRDRSGVELLLAAGFTCERL